MHRVLSCIISEHDTRLVILGAIICAFGCYTTLSVLARARIDDPQRASWSWLSAAAFVAGASMWATHFVALLSFQTGLPVGFGIWPTALSIAVAISASWLAFAAAHYLKAPIFGGALFGAAIAAMHFTGMAGLSLPARVHWDTSYVAASVFIGAALGAAALSVFARGLELGWRMAAAVLLMLAITALAKVFIPAKTSQV